MYSSTLALFLLASLTSFTTALVPRNALVDDRSVTVTVTRTTTTCPFEPKTCSGSPSSRGSASWTGPNSRPNTWTDSGNGPSSRCYTRIGSAPAPGGWQTSYTTSNLPCTSTLTSTSTATSTPSTVSTTFTVTSTTTSYGSTITDTATVSTTTTTTTTSTTTSTSTTTTTTTTTISTASTVPAPSGFLPIQTTLPNSGYTGKSGGSPIAKRGEPLVSKWSLPGGLQRNMTYPQAVVCASYVQSTCSTTVTTVTTTVSATSTPTNTITTTSTFVVTSTPLANTTITITATETDTLTSTATTTSTATDTQTTTSYTTTVYAACATNNFADNVGANTYFDTFTATSNAQTDHVAIANLSSAYECCVAAFTDPNGPAEGWGLFPGFGCFVDYVSGATCAANAQTNFPIASYGSGTAGEGYLIGNGCVGQFDTATDS